MPSRKPETLVNVLVEQDDGEILLAINGGEPERFPVHAGKIRVARGRLPEILAAISGAVAADEADLPDPPEEA